MRLSFLGKLAAGAMLSTMSAFPALALHDPNDPYVYMEEIEGARAYGDPANREARKVIDTYSPYQLLAKGKPHPKVFLETSTKDDRVHPARARKAAARRKGLDYDYPHYENIDGGHVAAANLNETAKRQALEYTYLSQQLMD